MQNCIYVTVQKKERYNPSIAGKYNWETRLDERGKMGDNGWRNQENKSEG